MGYRKVTQLTDGSTSATGTSSTLRFSPGATGCVVHAEADGGTPNWFMDMLGTQEIDGGGDAASVWVQVLNEPLAQAAVFILDEYDVKAHAIRIRWTNGGGNTIDIYAQERS